jgi:tRNA threonylcarbamoyladenosine biosynthesis protein TsaE
MVRAQLPQVIPSTFQFTVSIVQIYTTTTSSSINIFATIIQNQLQKEFTLETIHAAANEIWQKLQHYKVWAFDAVMGAGKTTFIHALCDVLEVSDTVGSPTFSIINQYQTKNGQTIYHLDLYRVKDEEEAIQAGVEDVLYSGELCLVEWPEKISSLLPPDTVYLSIDAVNSITRKISVRYPN